MRKYVHCIVAILISYLLYIAATGYMDPNSKSNIKRVLRRVDLKLVWTNKSMWFRDTASTKTAKPPGTWNDSSAMLVCVVSSDHERTDRLVRVLNSAFMPPNVSVRLLVAGGEEQSAALRAWRHGLSMVTRNVSTAWVGNKSECFVVMDDTTDPGPYLVFWFWRMCAERSPAVDLIAGDMAGSGLAPVYGLWKRFLRHDRRHENLTARLLAFYNNSALVCHPPPADDNVLVRAEYQPLTVREQPPRLARVWQEAFVWGAVGC